MSVLPIILAMFFDFNGSILDYNHFKENCISVTATAYTSSEREGTSDKITASNTVVEEGRTIAVSRELAKSLGYGRKVSLYINNLSSIEYLGEFVIEDCMSSRYKRRVDVYYDRYKDAMKFGKRQAFLYLQ